MSNTAIARNTFDASGWNVRLSTRSLTEAQYTENDFIREYGEDNYETAITVRLEPVYTVFYRRKGDCEHGKK